MTMDVGTNSNAEPNPEVGSGEGASKQTATPGHPRAFEGVAVHPVGDGQNTTNSLKNASGSNFSLTAQLEEAAAGRKFTGSSPGAAASGQQSDDVLSYRGVQYAAGERRYAREKLRVSRRGTLLQWFYDLPVSSKQLIGLISSEVISVIGLVGVGSLLIINGGRQQLLEQAQAELAVIDIQYNIKINQMGFGFRGQSENTAIVELAEAIVDNREADASQRTVVRDILQSEIDARSIEYATLVGLDGKILVNAQTERTGEEFDPYGLVSRVIGERQQIRENGLVERTELERQGIDLAGDDDNALIRYVVTPVFSQGQANRLVGVLVAGDVVNDKLSIVENGVSAFGEGYGAVYLNNQAGGWQLATSATLLQGENEVQSGEEIYDDTLLTTAVESQGEVVAQRVVASDDQANTYAMAARTLEDPNGDTIGVLVRGTSEASLQRLINRSLQTQFLIALLAILADIFLAQLLGRSIASPIKRLQQATEAFAGGNREAKARVFARDEVGQLAAAFNDLTDTVLQSEGTLMNQASVQAQAAQRANQLASLTSDLRKNIEKERLFSIAVNEVR